MLEIQNPLPDYGTLAHSIFDATFQRECICVHVALTGNIAESLVLATVAYFCPILSLTLETNVTYCKDISLLVTEKNEEVEMAAGQYSTLIVFYTGNTKFQFTDITLAIVVIVQDQHNFLVLDAIEDQILGQWNPVEGLAVIVESPWIQLVRERRLSHMNKPRVAMFECPPYVTYDRKQNVTHYDGIELRVVQTTLQEYNVSLLAQKEALQSSGAWSKVVSDVIQGEADIGICSLWLTTDLPSGLQLSTPWTRQKGTFLAPKPQPLSRAILIYLPLEFWTWVALGSISITFSLILHITGRLLSTQNKYRSIRLCFLNTFRTLLLNGLPDFPSQVSLRWLLIGWSFFSLLMATVYSSGYTSLLTSPLYSSPIDTLRDLLEQGIYWGEESENAFAYLIRESDNSKLIEFGNKFKREQSPQDRENRILKGNYAIFSKVMASAFVTETERLSKRARRMLRVMEEPVFTFHVGIGLRENSPYKTKINSRIVRLHDTGLLQYWQELIIHKLGYRYMNTFFTLQIDDDNLHALSLNSVVGAFSLLGFGLIVASVVCVIEITTAYMQRGKEISEKKKYYRKNSQFYINYQWVW